MKKKSRILLIFTLVFCQLAAFLMPAKAETTENTDEVIITESYYLLGSQEYEERAKLMAGEYQELILSLIGNSYYEENHIGMYNVTGIRNVNILCEVGATEYPDVLEMCNEISEEVKAYLVRYEVTAIEDTEFYANGEKYDIVFMGTVDAKRKILSINPAFATIITNYQNEGTITSRASLDLDVLICIPETIRVQMEDDTVSEIDFKLYCKKVAAAEVGFNSRNMNYHKACCIALKNYALYRILTAPYDQGFHLSYSSSSAQNYDPETDISIFPKVMLALDVTWKTFMVDANGNCILSEYRSGTKEEHDIFREKSSGTLLQDEAYEMSEEGDTYIEILNYFYSYSHRTNGAALNYKLLSLHSYTALLGGASKCSVCGHIKYDVAK